MQRYIHLVTTHYKFVLFFMFIATAFFGYQAKNLSINATAETLLLENDRDLKLTREIHARYSTPDYLVVAFTPTAPMLEADTIATIKSLKASLLKVDGIESVTTLLDVPLLQSPPQAITDLVKNVRTLQAPDINYTMAQKELTTSPLYADNLVSSDFKTTAIVVNLKDDPVYNELLKKKNAFYDKNSPLVGRQVEFEKNKEAFKRYVESTRDVEHKRIVAIRSAMEPYKISGELILGGVSMIADDMVSFVKSDIVIYGTAILVLMIAMLWIIFRQKRFVTLPILVSLSAVVITSGILAMAGLEVTVVSSNFVAMQLITTLSLVIHLIVSYREEYALYPNATQQELVEITLKRMSTPSIFVILTSVAGFGSLMTCDIVPIINLGTMMNIGVTISLVAAYLMFPAMMMLYEKKAPVLVFDERFTLNAKFAEIVENHRAKILTAVVLILGFSFAGVTKLVVENSFINYFKESTEIYKGMMRIDTSLGGTTPLEVVIKFDDSPKVATANSKAGSDELESFEDEFAIDESEAQYWFTQEKMRTISKVHDYLVSLKESGNVSSLGTLAKIGPMVKEGKEFDTFELAMMHNELPQEYKKFLLTPYVNTEANEARFVVRIVDSKDDLRRDALIKKIKKELHTKAGLKEGSYEVVGIMVLYNNMLQSLFDSQIATLGLALLMLGAMFLFLFRSLKIAMLAMMVNIVPVSVIFGIMGFSGIPLDIMSITIASIALGITVDNTIHYYYRFREELRIDGDYIAAMHRSHDTIAFGMFYYSLATIVGFLVLVTSNFIPTLIFGLLTVIVLMVAIVSDLLFSPLLVVVFKPFGSSKEL